MSHTRIFSTARLTEFYDGANVEATFVNIEDSEAWTFQILNGL